MNQKEKNQIPIILLVVGVIFVLIAGAAFVNREWRYLPELVKRLVLVAAVAGTMEASYQMARYPKLERAAGALYYLGTGLTGFATVSLLGGLPLDWLSLWWTAETAAVTVQCKMFLAHFVMLVLTGVRFWQKRDRLSFGLSQLLLYNSILWGGLACGKLWSFWEITCLALVISLGWTVRTHNRVLMTIQLGVGTMLADFQPYFEIPYVLHMEWHAAIMAAGVVLLGRIWYHKWKEIHWVQFALICRILLWLLQYDLEEGELVNVLILAVAGLAILVLAAIRNCREYVLMGAVLLLILIFYLTKDFWLSIAWWIYLLAAGIFLILVAVRKLMRSE